MKPQDNVNVVVSQLSPKTRNYKEKANEDKNT